MLGDSLRSDELDVFSQFIGWVYFAAWSISFWPQAILNYQRKSVTGLSLDYQVYNITGFLFYTTYTITKYVEQTKAGLNPSVQPNDIAFGVHAVLMTCVVLYQFHYYKSAGAAPISWAHAYIISILWVLALYTIILAAADSLPWYCAASSCSQISLIDYLGYGKAAISFIKYTPQAYLNWRRKSTVGWSITNILLDFTGGSLSFLQQFIDAYNYDDGSIIYGNIPKLLLAVESVGFDILFMIQHYVLYTNRADPLAGKSDLIDALLHQQHEPDANGHGGHSDDDKDVLKSLTVASPHNNENAALVYGAGNGSGNNNNYLSHQAVTPASERERINHARASDLQ